MEELKLTSNELYKLMKSSLRLGYAAGSSSQGNRTMTNAENKILTTIEGLKNTHKLK